MSAFRKIPAALAGVGAAFLLPCGNAWADGDTNGLKMGMARLHPSFGLSLKYDSYAVQLSRDEHAGDLILQVSPGAELELKGSSVDFTLEGEASYSRYLGVEADSATDASFVGVQAGTSLTARPTQSFSFTLSDSLRRSDKTQAPTIQVGVISLYNDAGLSLAWRPWHGTLHIEPSYHLGTEVFTRQSDFDNLTCEDGMGCRASDVEESNYLDHKAGLNLRWDFLPKSALLLKIGYDARRYTGDNGVDANSIDASVGLSSMLFPRLNATVLFGWSHDFDNTYSTPIARASISYALATQSKLSLVYSRRTSSTPGTTWVAYTSDQVRLAGNFLFAGRVEVDAGLGASFIGFKSKGGHDGKNTTEVNFGLKGTYEILSWLSAGLSYDLTYDDRMAGIRDFVRHEVAVFANVRY